MQDKYVSFSTLVGFWRQHWFKLWPFGLVYLLGILLSTLLASVAVSFIHFLSPEINQLSVSGLNPNETA